MCVIACVWNRVDSYKRHCMKQITCTFAVTLYLLTSNDFIFSVSLQPSSPTHPKIFFFFFDSMLCISLLAFHYGWWRLFLLPHSMPTRALSPAHKVNILIVQILRKLYCGAISPHQPECFLSAIGVAVLLKYRRRYPSIDSCHSLKALHMYEHKAVSTMMLSKKHCMLSKMRGSSLYPVLQAAAGV